MNLSRPSDYPFPESSERIEGPISEYLEKLEESDAEIALSNCTDDGLEYITYSLDGELATIRWDDRDNIYRIEGEVQAKGLFESL